MNSSDRLACYLLCLSGAIAIGALVIGVIVPSRSDIVSSGLSTSGTMAAMVGGYLKNSRDEHEDE